MGINRAEETLDKRLVNEVRNLRRDLNDSKTAQPVGQDTVTIGKIPQDGIPVGIAEVTVVADGSLSISVAFIPKNSRLTLWNFAVTMFVDPVPGFLNNYKFPDGISLTSAQRKFQFSSWLDYVDSADAQNIRSFKIFIRNNDTASHNIFVNIMAYQPQAITEGLGYAV